MLPRKPVIQQGGLPRRDTRRQCKAGQECRSDLADRAGAIAELLVRHDKYVRWGKTTHMPREVGKALLFDIDGTLADTDALHLEAFNKVFGPRGHVFDHARFTKVIEDQKPLLDGEVFTTSQ
jgi:hypothetical protein